MTAAGLLRGLWAYAALIPWPRYVLGRTLEQAPPIADGSPAAWILDQTAVPAALAWVCSCPRTAEASAGD